MVGPGLAKWTSAALAAKKAANDNRFEPLSRLTLVIASYRRQDCLLRQVVYWAHSPASIVIMDGSPEPLDESLQDLIGSIPNIMYRHIADTYPGRLRKACQFIKTPFAMALADDDFFLMTGLCRAIENLEKHANLVACMGQAMAVEYDHQKKFSFFYPYGGSLRQYRITQPAAADRLRRGMEEYRSATSYAVFRTPVFTEIWDTVGTWSCPWVVEYAQAMLTYILGELSTIEDVYWLRSFEYDTISNTTDWNLTIGVSEWWNSEKFRPEREDFVGRLAGKLAGRSSLSVQESGKAIEGVMDSILFGKHAGLVDPTISDRIIAGTLDFIKKSRLLEKWRKRVWATGLFRRIRNKIRMNYIGVTLNPREAAGSGMDDPLSREAEDVLKLMAGFYAALE